MHSYQNQFVLNIDYHIFIILAKVYQHAEWHAKIRISVIYHLSFCDIISREEFSILHTICKVHVNTMHNFLQYWLFQFAFLLRSISAPLSSVSNFVKHECHTIIFKCCDIFILFLCRQFSFDTENANVYKSYCCVGILISLCPNVASRWRTDCMCETRTWCDRQRSSPISRISAILDISYDKTQ